MMPVANRKKVRSGCGTCRIRKVKCDEFKPVCKRCHSTGRECEGYGIWGGGGNGYAARYGSQKAHILPLQHHHPVAKLHLSTEDHVYLEWFHHRLVHDLSSQFAEGFWTELVMPALLNEPIIAHAVIALSSAHKDATLATEHTQLESERVVVAHYNRSMRQLRSAIETGKETTAGLALVSCLLYTLLDRLRGRFAQAEIHLQSGLRLLRDVHQRSCVNTYAGTTLLKRSTNEDPDRVKILQGFASLHLESQLLGTDSPGMDILVQSCVEDVPPSAFPSIEQARNSLDKIIHAILLISRHALRVTIAEQEYPLSRLDARNQALYLLQAWLKTYKATSFCETKTVRDHQFARTVLFNRYDMALAMWGHIGCTSESGYMSQTATFLAILERSVAMWHILPSLSAAESTSVSDNLVTPLFFTALKCRILLIRLQAVRLLKAIRLSAGGWSSTLMANVASEVMMLEQDVCHDRIQRDSSQFTDISTVSGVDCMLHSSLNLIHGVAIGSWDRSANILRIRCKQRTSDGEVKILNRCITIPR